MYLICNIKDQQTEGGNASLAGQPLLWLWSKYANKWDSLWRQHTNHPHLVPPHGWFWSEEKPWEGGREGRTGIPVIFWPVEALCTFIQMIQNSVYISIHRTGTHTISRLHPHTPSTIKWYFPAYILFLDHYMNHTCPAVISCSLQCFQWAIG